MDGTEDLLCSLLPREGGSAFVLTHLAFVDASILGKTAGIDEAEVLEEGGDVIAESHLIFFRNTIPISDGQFAAVLYALAEISFSILDSIAITPEMISAETLVGRDGISPIRSFFNYCCYLKHNSI